MKVLAVCIALFAANALAKPLAVTLDVEYYPKAGCKTGGKTVNIVTGSTKCYNTAFVANSFKVAGTVKLPNGCTLKGFENKNCGGFEQQYIDGPSLGKCDAAANSSGTFHSIQINCD